MSTKRIIIAAGGTGGHLFPAQALACDLSNRGCEVMFVGGGAASNPYLDRARFACKEIDSMTPFGGKKRLFTAPFVIGKGVWQSLQLLKKRRCDLVVGFGSFHTFPILFAAQLKRVPIVLFEPNAVMGRVNRVFAKRAKCVAVQFEKTSMCDLEKQRLVAFPFFQREAEKGVDPYTYFSLDPQKKTLLIVGGSQGAKWINQIVLTHAEKIAQFNERWQLLHIIGKREEESTYKATYESFVIRACVKRFEMQMPLAWEIADLALCRSGAGTVAEQMRYGVPALFFPFPYATDDHQRKNGEVVEKLGGGVCLNEKNFETASFRKRLQAFLESDRHIEGMRESLMSYNAKMNRDSLAELIENHLNGPI